MTTEILNRRVFPVLGPTLFEAFRNPDHIAAWWGPNGFTNTMHEYDFRPGGLWRIVMHGPNGSDFDNQSVFEEIVPPERIVFRHLGPVHEYRMTMSFVEKAGGTELTWCMRFDPPVSVELEAFLYQANEQNFDRLEARLGLIE